MSGDDGVHQFFRIAMVVRMIDDGGFHTGIYFRYSFLGGRLIFMIGKHENVAVIEDFPIITFFLKHFHLTFFMNTIIYLDKINVVFRDISPTNL